MAQTDTQAIARRRDHVVIAVGLYLFISVASGFYTFMRAFDIVGCTGTCDLTVMGHAVVWFVYADAALLALTAVSLLILGLLRRRVLWLAVSVLVTISALAIVANVTFTVAQTTGTG